MRGVARHVQHNLFCSLPIHSDHKDNLSTKQQLTSAKDICYRDVTTAGLTAFTIMSTLSVLHTAAFDIDNCTLLGSFGASCFVLTVNPAAPIAQPRNVIGGHMVGATCGIATHGVMNIFQCVSEHGGITILPQISKMMHCYLPVGISGPVAVSVAVMLMICTRTIHFPAGGTALGIAVSPTLPYTVTSTPLDLTLREDCVAQYAHQILASAEVATLCHVLFSSSTLVALACLLHRGSYPFRS